VTTTPVELKIGPVRTDGVEVNRRVPALDGLRGLAIIAVFLYHYGAGGSTSSVLWVRCFSRVLGIGWSGVDLFFVLSGFLITGILFNTQTDPEYYKNFYVRRVLRIFPIYYIAIAAVFVIGIALGVHWTRGHIWFLFFLGYPAVLLWPHLIPLSPFIRITHLWSLSVEEQFYMVWPWAVRKLQSGRNVLVTCALVFVMALVLRVVFVESGHSVWASTFLFCRMDTLAVGSALAVAVRRIDPSRLQKAAISTFLLAVAAFVAIGTVAHSFERSQPAIAIWGYSLTAIACGALLLMSLGVGSRLFSFPVLRLFGKYSYGLYLYHFPLTAVFEPLKPMILVRVGSFAAGSLIYVAICLAINLGVAALSFHFIEAPFLRLKKRFNKTGRTATLPGDNRRFTLQKIQPENSEA
jgi:peptidoglycan/LPS O-acetylase OafA/YrhL